MYKKSVQEVGRSILEMLGVLAIVGILSVVGVVGWQYGMDKYAANDVLNEANIRGFDVLANYKDRKLPDLTMLPGYQKKTTTGRPIFVIPNPSDFNWAEYPEKCESADYCQAFDVEVRGVTERQCEIIMNSDWRLPDSIFVTQTPQNTTMTTPLAITASADRIAKRTTAKLNTNLCHFSDVDIDLTLRFRFVSTYTDFSNTKDDSGWDETTPTPDDGETGGGESVEEEPEDTSCPTGQERNDKGDCVCKPNHYGESCIECLSPRKWDDIYGCICAGVKSVWDSGEQTCVCPANHYGANCVRCMEPREWVNNDCICNGPKSVWNNETQLCECPENYYTEDCSVYCAGEYASWNGTACVCSFRNSEWSSTERACVCKDDYYGTNCDYCAGEHTKWDDGNNRCICTLQNSTWNKDKNVCECLNNYYGSNCDYCFGDHTKWDDTNNKCICTLANSSWTGSACVCNTNYHGPNCDYCFGDHTQWDDTNNKCICTLANSSWTGSACVCNTNYHGPNCDYCFGDHTQWDSTNNKCTCTQTSREWNAGKKACVCKTGYWGDNCTYCAGTNASWDSTNKKCVCSSGSWSASSKKCVTTGSTQDTCYAPKVWSGGSCACPSDTPYYQSGTNKCVKCYQADESEPYWNGLTCTTCPSDNPTWDSTNKQCVACTTAKPYWDSATQTCKTCYEVNNAEPKWNTSTSACEACPTANPIWNGSSCITTATWCTNQMKSGGFSSGYSVSGSTITYSGNMTVSKNLDISKCNLTVNGTLTINSGITLTALAVSATSSSGHGVRNSGIVIATSLLGKSTETQDNIYHHGIFNDGGTITVSNGTVTGETADQGKGIYSWNYNSTAQISAKTIKGTCTGNPCTGIDNSGIITATTSLTGTGTTGITHSGGGTITVTNGSVTGTGSSSYGINLSSGQITAKTITGKSNGTSSTGYGIKIDRNCILTGTGSITGSGYVGIKNEGTITATGITVTGTGVSDGIYNNYSSAKISAATIKGTSTSTGLYSGIVVAYGTITATTSVIGTGTTGIDVYSGTITATNGSVSGTGSTGRGIDVSSGKITAKTIEGNGYFGIYNEGTIKGTNSITGIGSSQGIWNNDGTITATVTVTGKATDSEGIYNNSSINSPTIKGSSTNGSGISSYGTLTASSSIIGTGKRYGINNRGTITATNASISGTGNSMDGIYNRVKITAKTITGKSTNGYGINNTQSSSSIIATNIYYCKTRQNNGTISGTQKCASGCTCTN